MTTETKKDYRNEKGFQEIWDSWRYLFKHDLEKLDFRTRAMLTEMKLECVKNPYIAENLPIVFKALVDEVLNEQNKADKRGKKKAAGVLRTG